ncbi:hypothetical protein BaRGS_00021067, partial [Batillaria attramentaria]
MAAAKYQCLIFLCLVGNVWLSPLKDAERAGEIRHKRSDDATPLQAVVDNLTHQLNVLTARVDAQQNKL